MNISDIKNHFTNWREWELNPIVIKELRQGVRSWTVTGMLLLFLVVLFIASLGFLVTESFDINPNMQLGGSMFSAFTVILAGASIFFIPLYTAVRVAAERQENNPDLLYVTTLSPARIIRGKFLCSAYIALLFFSACMPFMAFTNLLRGVDLPTVFFILAYLFLVVCAANMIAIFVACIPASRPFKVLFALGGFFASFWIVIPLVEISWELMRSGVGAMMSGRDFWIGVLTAAAIGLAATGLFFVLSVALVSPPSANRALPVRIYLTVIWLLGGLLNFGWVAQTGDAERMNIWTFSTFAVMMFALLVTISNSDQISQRVRRTIPAARVKRFFAFFFFNGAAGGLLWTGGILIATYFASQTVMLFLPTAAYPSILSMQGQIWFATTAAYAFAYALTALFIHRNFLSRRPPKLAGLLAVLLAAAWAIAPSVVLFFLNQLSWKSVEGLQLGNIFNVASLRDDDQRLYHLYFAFGWLLVMIVINAKWFFRQANNFRPPPVAPPVLK
jgi:hypothetical protein